MAKITSDFCNFSREVSPGGETGRDKMALLRKAPAFSIG